MLKSIYLKFNKIFVNQNFFSIELKKIKKCIKKIKIFAERICKVFVNNSLI
jgi:hypothetical protein